MIKILPSVQNIFEQEKKSVIYKKNVDTFVDISFE